ELVESTQQGVIGSCTALPSGLAGGPSANFHPDHEHQIVSNSTKDNHKLVVFLPGHGASPSGYTDFLEHAAGFGYHVIGLSYWNVASISSLCGSDMDCYGAVRREIFDFQQPSSSQHEINWILDHKNSDDCGDPVVDPGQTVASSKIGLHDGFRNRL